MLIINAVTSVMGSHVEISLSRRYARIFDRTLHRNWPEAIPCHVILRDGALSRDGSSYLFVSVQRFDLGMFVFSRCKTDALACLMPALERQSEKHDENQLHVIFCPEFASTRT